VMLAAQDKWSELDRTARIAQDTWTKGRWVEEALLGGYVEGSGLPEPPIRRDFYGMYNVVDGLRIERHHHSAVLRFGPDEVRCGLASHWAGDAKDTFGAARARMELRGRDSSHSELRRHAISLARQLGHILGRHAATLTQPVYIWSLKDPLFLPDVDGPCVLRCMPGDFDGYEVRFVGYLNLVEGVPDAAQER
jgi:hypothetical protein